MLMVSFITTDIKAMKESSQHTTFIEPIDETFQSVRTPKKLLTRDPKTTGDQDKTALSKRKFKINKPKMFKRRKAKKTTIRASEAPVLEEENYQISGIFGKRFDNHDIHSSIGKLLIYSMYS